jgi:DNA-binding transcriptional regulator GbsR (MarR family)
MENKNKCGYCDKYFSSRQSKWNHINKFHKNINIEIPKNTNNICVHCNKNFSSKSCLSRHLKSYCKTKNEIINKVLNEKKIDNKVNITINNNINNIQNNYQNNILNINPIDKPNTQRLLNMDICTIFDKEFDMILKLIERTYFNSSIEENHTFYVSNLQGQYINVYNNEDNTTQIKKFFFDELFSISLDRIKTLYKEYGKKLFELPKQVEIKEKIATLEDMRNENNHTYKSYLKLINVLAYDKKDLIMNTWTKLKQMELMDTNKDPDEIIWDRDIDL